MRPAPGPERMGACPGLHSHPPTMRPFPGPWLPAAPQWPHTGPSKPFRGVRAGPGAKDTLPSQAASSLPPPGKELSHGPSEVSGRDCWVCPGQWVQDREREENVLRHSETSSSSGAKSPGHTAIGGQQPDQGAVGQQAPWDDQAQGGGGDACLNRGSRRGAEPERPPQAPGQWGHSPVNRWAESVGPGGVGGGLGSRAARGMGPGP